MHVVRTILSVALVLMLAAPALAGPVETLVKFDHFRAIEVPAVPMRNVAGGGLPWVLTSVEAKVDADGVVKAEVVGLVFAPGTPAAGTVGPITHYAATLSCLNDDGTINNLTTRGVPVTTTGDAKIKDQVALPETCLAPVILIRAFNAATSTAGAWFAVSGF